MALTPLAQKIADRLDDIANNRSGMTVDDLLDYYNSFGPSLSTRERREAAALLGIKPNLKDFEFRELVPPGWFADVIDIQHQSETPAPFYFLASLVVLSNLVGRKVMIDRGSYSIGADVSALLVSPAGRGRRSTACDFVVYQLGEPAGLAVIADSFTYEHMGDQMIETCEEKPGKASKRAVNAQTLLYAAEMSALLGKGSYAESIIPKLTDLLGKTSRFNWGTVKRGKVEFVNPCVSALFTSAPDWLVDNIPAVAFGGGTMSRFLMAVQEHPARITPWAEPIPTEDIQDLVAQLQDRATASGTFQKPNAEATEWFATWYTEHQEQFSALSDNRLVGWHSRKHDHLLRVAALLILGAGDKLEFTVERLEQALKIIEWLEMDIPKAYAGMALSPTAAAQFTVYKELLRNKEMTHSALHRRVHRQLPLSDEFERVMNSLVLMKVVRPWKGAGNEVVYTLLRELE